MKESWFAACSLLWLLLYLPVGQHLEDQKKLKVKDTVMQMVSADWLRSDKREDDHCEQSKPSKSRKTEHLYWYNVSLYNCRQASSISFCFRFSIAINPNYWKLAKQSQKWWRQRKVKKTEHLYWYNVSLSRLQTLTNELELIHQENDQSLFSGRRDAELDSCFWNQLRCCYWEKEWC